MDHRAGGISERWPGFVALSREDGGTSARRGALSRSRHLLALAAHAPAAGAGSPSHLQHRQPAARPASARPSRPSSWAPVWGLREARTVHEAGGLARSPRPELSVAEPSLNLVLSQFKIQCPCELAGWTPASALPGNRLVGWGEEREPEGGIPARVPARSTTPGFGSRPRAAQQSGRGLWPPGPRALGSSLAPRCPAPPLTVCAGSQQLLEPEAVITGLKAS